MKRLNREEAKKRSKEVLTRLKDELGTPEHKILLIDQVYGAISDISSTLGCSRIILYIREDVCQRKLFYFSRYEHTDDTYYNFSYFEKKTFVNFLVKTLKNDGYTVHHYEHRLDIIWN